MSKESSPLTSINVATADPTLGADKPRVFTWGSSVNPEFWIKLTAKAPHLFLDYTSHMCSNTLYLLACAAQIQLAQELFIDRYKPHIATETNIPEFIREPIYQNEAPEELYYYSPDDATYLPTGIVSQTILLKPDRWGMGRTGIAINNSEPSTLIVRRKVSGTDSKLILERFLPAQVTRHDILDYYIPSFRTFPYNNGYKAEAEEQLFKQLIMETMPEGESIHENLFALLAQIGTKVDPNTLTLSSPLKEEALKKEEGA